MATLGLSKVFILDKYFTELQKFWETEKKLQGKLDNILVYPVTGILSLLSKSFVQGNANIHHHLQKFLSINNFQRNTYAINSFG